MSDQQQGPGWWLASDGKWYPPEGAPPLPPPQTWAPGPPLGPPPKRGMSAGAIVALVIGGVVGLLVLAVVAIAVLGDEAETTFSDVGSSSGGSDSNDEGASGTTAPEPDVPEGFELVEGDGVAMATPAGWEIIDAADVAMGRDEFVEAFPNAPPEMVEQGMNVFEQGAVLVAFDVTDGGFASNVNVIKIPGEAPIGLIEDQAVQQLATLGGEVVESGRVDLAIGEALRIEYTLTVAGADGSSVPAEGVQFYLPVEGSTYVITVSTDAGAAALADRMVETFRLR